jgi:nicotinamidase-related amidase
MTVSRQNEISTKNSNQQSHAKHALLLIDFQNDFLMQNGRMPVSQSQVEPALAAAKAAIESARAVGDPILAIGNEFRKNDHLMNFFRRGAAIEGSEGARWDQRLPLDGIDYLPKWAGSAFVNPDLEKWFKANNIASLTMTGVYARACVTLTAKDALRRGYQVRILSDAVACASARTRRAALKKLERAGASIAVVEDYRNSNWLTASRAIHA